ncbi:cation diffusion facilitator family transporter [Candidatus Acetatifactor stercoripullorum]|uniref:cation diffusion facilitator family transporter n=1 Tax=Candidatus Acetatifactor stercoripullorum TaxID=2838414 RepID=UPI00298DEEAE|nr:cation diffusion facilitator family transporter [Candidatus Acetatifactor stercoripullorum]
MITLLSKFFIKNRENTQDPGVRQAYGVLCGAVGIFLNLLLFGSKFLAGMLSGSIAITADAFNNLSDAGSSIITLIGFKMAGQKPDPDHPFGHGRIEYISGLFVSVIILLMGFELIKSSAEKIFHPEELTYSPTVLVILLASILVKCYMAAYNKSISKKINSSAMKATATDSLSDCLATAVVLAATLISHFTGLSIDGWCGVLVGLFICYAGFEAAKDTISPLLGQAPDPEFVKQVNDIVMSYDGVLGIHDMIVHNYGPGRILISLHAEVPADGDLLTLHDMIDVIEHKLRDTLHCSAVIHMDPVCVGDEETEHLKELVTGYLKEISPSISIHDFRIVKGPTHTNVIFDIAVPYDFPMTDEELIETAQRRIQRENPNYFAVIEVDKQYVPEKEG